MEPFKFEKVSWLNVRSTASENIPILIPSGLWGGGDHCGIKFPENLRNFFAATASCSPFLFSQIQNERDWLVDVIKEKEFDLLSLLHPLKSEAYDALYFKLRLAKRRAALWIAICDLADIWSPNIFQLPATNLDIKASLNILGTNCYIFSNSYYLLHFKP